jgi:DNA-binding response OmpR family regulator
MEAVKILVVEDDREINQLVSRYLGKEGYEIQSAYDGQEALRLISENEYHLIVLDLMLPVMDGFEVLRRIREKGVTPVLILSAKSEDPDKIIGLGLGADDYVTKPFHMGVFIARVKALLRRSLYFQEKKEETTEILRYKGLTLNLSTCMAYTGETPISLTAKEFELLKLFLTNPTRVFTKSQLFQAVWKDDYMTDDNTVMVHIRKIRKKIEKDPSEPKYIQTVWGFGYKLGEGEQ